VKRHAKSSHASATAATDGERLVVFFGSEGLHCLDLDGNILWSKQFGVLDAGYFVYPEAQWEFGNSPVIYDGKVIVLADVQQGGFLAALRLEDGEELWRVPRHDVPTWGAPLVVATGERTQVVVNGWRHSGGYDLETGEEIWHVDGGGDLPVPSPIYGDGRFYFTSAHGSQAPVFAVADSARGFTNLSEGETDGLAWIARRKGAYMATPLLLDGLLYVVRWNGILVCLNPETGEVVYEKRLRSGAYTASPVGGDGKIYVANEEGDILTVRSGTEFEVLSRTATPDPILASPAISEGVLYFRTGREMIAIGQ
jgi:outer membrane protein assembly factor BamB